VVFAETGIFFCFFFPGDYLLFTAGLLSATGVIDASYPVLIACLFPAAVLGNVAGFYFGKFLGHRFETMRESLFFKRVYLENTRHAFVKYGPGALIVGRFLPVVRTFAPIVAGATGFKFSKFIGLNLLGGAAWVVGLTSIGYFLGIKFPGIVHYIEYIIIAFVAVTSVILIRTINKVRNDQKARAAQPPKGTKL
jgi:membrane-associated protein